MSRKERKVIAWNVNCMDSCQKCHNKFKDFIQLPMK